MSSADVRRIVRWFGGTGTLYVDQYLGRRQIDVHRLSSDRTYGLRAFLFHWAYARAGAPRAFRICAVKAVATLARSKTAPSHLPRVYRPPYHGTRNAASNPALDSRIALLDVPRIIR